MVEVLFGREGCRYRPEFSKGNRESGSTVSKYGRHRRLRDKGRKYDTSIE